MMTNESFYTIAFTHWLTGITRCGNKEYVLVKYKMSFFLNPLKKSMSVDKFGHTDVGYSQRVIAGGVTLSQVNAIFFRLDGTNAMTPDLIFNNNKLVKGLPTSCPPIYVGDEVVSWSQAVKLRKDETKKNETVPANDKHLTNKKYVDDRDALKVSKAGDTMTGNLLLRIGSSHTIL